MGRCLPTALHITLQMEVEKEAYTEAKMETQAALANEKSTIHYLNFFLLSVFSAPALFRSLLLSNVTHNGSSSLQSCMRADSFFTVSCSDMRHIGSM